MEQIISNLKFITNGEGFLDITNNLNLFIQENDFCTGIFNLTSLHTSCSLTINENADPRVRRDFETHFNKMVPETANYFEHVCEGTDDMTSHIKSSLLGSSISFPIKNGIPQLGTWQGIYLCEHRNSGGNRKIILTVIGG